MEITLTKGMYLKEVLKENHCTKITIDLINGESENLIEQVIIKFSSADDNSDK